MASDEPKEVTPVVLFAPNSRPNTEKDFRPGAIEDLEIHHPSTKSEPHDPLKSPLPDARQSGLLKRTDDSSQTDST